MSDDSPHGATASTLDLGAERSPGPREVVLVPGDRIERFRVLDVLGAGGMGLVVSAYDEVLDRRIAIKMLRPDRVAPGNDTGRARLLREARALAQLTHPNVVTVYEAGEYRDGVYLAMQYVDGETLSTWLAREPRGWRDVLRLFLAAGQGLSAAHRAGMVHRDFKPDNVLVAKDGAVRVADFGLVGVTPRETPADEDGGEHEPAHLTITGSRLGTPAYMSPEQHRGEAADARADQFSFCVALYEALYGVRPFSGRRTPELLDAIAAGHLATPASGADVPPAVRDAIARGLAADPDERWPDMAALLAALARDRATARRRWIAGGAGVAVLAAAALLVPRRGDAEVCSGGAARVAGVWDAARRERVRGVFLATGLPAAAAAFDRVDAALRARLAAWTDGYTAACRDTRVHGVQSEATLDLRMACLERSRRQLDNLTGLWLDPAQLDLGRAVSASLTTGDVRGCADAEALAAPLPLPTSPAARQAVDAVRTQLDRQIALARSGRVADALAAARAAVTAARQAGYAPALAEALRRQGALACENGAPDDGIALLEEAVRAAGDGHADGELAVDLRELVGCLGVRAQRFKEAEALYVAAEAATARAGAAPDDGARLLLVRANLQYLQDHAAEAVTDTERALTMLEAAGASPVDLVQYRSNLIVFDDALRRFDDGARVGAQALALAEGSLGADHPLVADILNNLSMIASSQEDTARSAQLDERALAIREKVFPPESAQVAQSLHNLATTYMDLGRDDDARPLLERAAAIREKILGPDHPDLARTVGALGQILSKQGDHAAARAMFERAVAIKVRAYGEHHVSVAHSLGWLGTELIALRDFRAARAALDRALAIRTAGDGERNPDLADVLNGLAEIDLAEGHPAQAVARLERSLRVVEATLGKDHWRSCRPLTLLSRAHRGAAGRRELDHAALVGKGHPCGDEAAHALAAR